nr:uncharacterized protein LOC128684184 isoform X2 [Cherax quadricarinatus]
MLLLSLIYTTQHTTMTPIQWLAVPTEIRLPNLVNSPADNLDSNTIYLNGKKVIIKEEECDDSICSEDGNSSSMYIYPVGAGVLSSQEGVQNFALDCPPVSPERKCSVTTQAPPDVIIVKSKPKNPDYKVRNNILATKRSKPVHCKIVRARPGMRVYISMSYQGHIYGDKPVTRCKKHDECSWCKDHEYNQCFCVISKCHKFEIDKKGQPVAVITVSQDHLDNEGNVEFSLVFSCWNSCDTHSRFGKELNLKILILDSKIIKIEYSIHCCQNLLRDAFKDRKRDPHTTPGIKRKQVSIPDSNCEEGLDAERRDIIERMVKIMGGKTFPIPHLAKLKGCESLNKKEEQSTLNEKE